ncbi:hypothetical protein SLS60_005014 [Paraconiothyrium brasiliense]|uniref:Uncharacterized protein n=1 Tax=Paraconiothyrium brasiliense TaxID=300254 RepID=A0ABR3RGD7_9PLEO
MDSITAASDSNPEAAPVDAPATAQTGDITEPTTTHKRDRVKGHIVAQWVFYNDPESDTQHLIRSESTEADHVRQLMAQRPQNDAKLMEYFKNHSHKERKLSVFGPYRYRTGGKALPETTQG